MPRIIFVDDERNVLQGLRRMFHSMRHEWDMLFLGSAAEALEHLNEGFCDVLVSDLRMPGMDGIELLEEVRRRSPETVRIALTGDMGKELALRAVGPMHQFLSKLCDPETLRVTMVRAVALGRLLTDTRLKKLAAEMESLPALPLILQKVTEKLEAPGASVKDIGRLIAQDPAMSAKVLQLANSAFLGLPQPVADPVQATVILGLDTIEMLVFSVKIFEQFSRDCADTEHVEALWAHSVAAAGLARDIALDLGMEDATAERTFLAGLLHDLGKLVFLANFPEPYAMTRRLANGQPRIQANVEQRAIGATHGEMGAYLMGLWGFSDTVVEAIAHHHEPMRAVAPMAASPLAAVHIADMLLHYQEAPAGADVFGYVDREFVQHLRLMPALEKWQGWRRPSHSEDDDVIQI